MKCDLQSGMFERQSRQTLAVSHSPRRATPVLAAVTQQKTLKMLPRSRRDLPDDAAPPDQVAHGFMIGVRSGSATTPPRRTDGRGM
jgi:hypothetical protein